MNLSKVLKGRHSRDIGRYFFASPNGLSGLRIATTSAFLQILGIFSWSKQEVRKWNNQDSIADPEWSINSEKIESITGDFPGSRELRTVANSSSVKGLKMLFPSSVRTFHRWGTSSLTSLLSRAPLSCLSRYSRVARRWILLRRGTYSMSRHSSKFLVGAPHLAAGMHEVDGINNFLLLLPSLPCQVAEKGVKWLCQS